MVNEIKSLKEKTIMDVITGSIYSLNFLRNISEAIFEPGLQSLKVGELYEQWLKVCGYPRGIIPYNFGAILGNLYCGILLSKEQWFDLLPEHNIDELSSEWGFLSATYFPQKPSPTIKYAFRRMRNALGHGNIFFNFPSAAKRNRKDEADFEKKLTVKFYDEDKRKPGDFFIIENSLFGLLTAIREFHKLAHEYVITR